MDIPLAPLLVAALVAVGAGGYFLLRGGQRVRGAKEFSRSAQVANAEITDLRLRYPRHNRDHNDGWWVPVLRFSLPDGRVVEAEAMAGSNPPPGRVGEQVAVQYDPGDPARVHLARGAARPRSLGTIWMVVGTALCLVGLVVLAGWAVLVLVLRVPG